jgi:SAM-dependent methyltransferase
VYQYQDQLLAATGEAEARHFWFRGFRRFVTPILDRAVRGTSGLQHPGTSALQILDCGCGTGGNVEWLSRYGRTSGIDYTFSGLAAGRRAGRRGLAQATAATLPFSDATFDLVTSFDVLQMLPDALEREVIGDMARVLKPDGALVVNVPAMPVLRGDHALLSEEVRRYSRGELGTKLRSAGFTLEWITHTNATLFPLMLATRAWQRWRGARPQTSDISIPAAPINAALTGLLAIESLVVSKVALPVGSSIVCLARKSRRD